MDTSLKKHGFRYCLVCKSRLKKRGKTAAGRQRWYCRVCTQSSVRKRTDLRHLFTFEQFIEWLLGKASQAELGVASRTFRHQTSWCWDVPVPLVQTGEIHHAVIIDGIRVGGRTCLVARTTEYVIDWVWVPYESSEYWSLLLQQIPPPMYVVCDGQRGMLKALSLWWPNTTVQRCRFHAWLNVKAKLTLNPQTIQGKQLLQLARDMQHVTTRRQARCWKRRLSAWYRKHSAFIQEKTIKQYPKRGERTWCYTHTRVRSAYRQLHAITDDLMRSIYRRSPRLPATTNHLEGGINSHIRDKLRTHRGMKNEHQRVLVNWYLYGRTEGRKAPRNCL